MYRNVIELILYPTTVPNSLMSSRSFVVASLGYSTYSILSYANSDSFTSSFSGWINFISLSSLNAMARTFKIMLTKTGESGHSCLVPDLRGNAFTFSLLNMMLTVDLSYIDFIILRYVPPMPTSWRVFIIYGYWIFVKSFSASIEMILRFLLFNLLMWCIIVIDLYILKNPCIPGINTSW